MTTILHASRLCITALIVAQLGTACSGESIDSGAMYDQVEHEQPVSIGVAREAISLATTSAEYKFPATVDPDVLSDRETELWARVYAPAQLDPGERYPLLVFLHGNRSTCGTGTNPRRDHKSHYTDTGECPEGYVVTPSHDGYGYIADEMASQGYIVVSINANRGINAGSGASGDGSLILARARLVLKHLLRLAQWDRGELPTPSSLGFDQVGMMGHSRGGPGVRAAYYLYDEIGSTWPSRIGTPIEFQSIFEIAPTDNFPSHDAVGVHWAALLPMCDTSVFGLDGIRSFDRSMALTYEHPPHFRATATVWGTNHNFYNSEWQYSDAGRCVGHEPLFQAENYIHPSGWYTPGVTGSEEQRAVGKALVTSFFLGTVGANSDLSEAAIFDPRNELGPEITSITRVDRGFNPSPNWGDVLRLEEFTDETGIGMTGAQAMITHVNVEYTELFEHDPSYRGAHVTWTSASYDRIFQPHFADEGYGLPLSRFDTLDFRVDLAIDEELNVTESTNFSIRLVDRNGFVSYPVDISDYVDLSNPVRRHSMLQTVRIPLTDFGGLSLEHIRGVRFSFDDTETGSIYLASIRASTGGIPAGN